jgi:FkbM family methyltransferase
MKAKNLRFVYDNLQDCIQQSLYNGTFWEEAELDKISKYIKPNSIILDIGANIGNHAIYFDKFVSPKAVYVIEPLSRAITMMLQNIALTYSHTINVDHIGIALSDRECYTIPYYFYENNMGATEFVEITEEEAKTLNIDLNYCGVKTVTGDSLFENIDVDFMKIDVENMELKVLAGLKNTIDKNKPIIFIEVHKPYVPQFTQWLSDNNYYIIECTDNQINYLIGPKTI